MLSLYFNSLHSHWTSLSMLFSWLQIVFWFEACQPFFTKIQSFILQNLSQINKPCPLLSQDFTGENNIILKSLHNPQLQHLINLWILGLNCTLCGALLLTTSLWLGPLCTLLLLIFHSIWYVQLFNLELWIRIVEVLWCLGLISSIFLVPVKNLNVLFQCCIFFHRLWFLFFGSSSSAHCLFGPGQVFSNL